MTECMAEEFKEKDIKANCLALGAVQTEMLESAFPGYKAPISDIEMADYINNFALTGHKIYNGKILPVSVIDQDREDAATLLKDLAPEDLLPLSA